MKTNKFTPNIALSISDKLYSVWEKSVKEKGHRIENKPNFRLLGQNEKGQYRLQDFYNHYRLVVLAQENEFDVADSHIGYNPKGLIGKSLNINYYRQDIKYILSHLGFDRNWMLSQDEDRLTDFDPIIILSSGEVFHYQRPFVYTLEQQQDVIEAIYNDNLSGAIIVRDFEYDDREKKKKLYPNQKYRELVDGKQRITTILRFVRNEFPDKDGFYFKDLSKYSQQCFLGRDLGFGSIKCSDKEVLLYFLKLNTKVVPQNPEHLKNIQDMLNRF